MYSDIKVTVVVMGDCAKEELDKCIYSIIGQTHSLFEVLVVLKRDSIISAKDIENFNDNRISCITCNSDSGPSEMFNEGFCWKCSTSKYCVCIDGNDWIGLDYLDAMITEMEDNPYDILYGGTVLLDTNGDKICNAPEAVWNKIYACEIDWDHAQMGKTQKSTYFRRKKDFGFCENEKKFDWRYFNLKTAVLDKNYEYISFDVFDTLVQRPFYSPEDLFLLLDVEFEKHVPCSTSFSVFRRAGEAELRSKYAGTDIEDVTIDEIYEQIGEMFHISNDILRQIKEYEKSLEIKYTQERKAIKDIYLMLKDLGKKIILITDMYLDRETIEFILKKNGYEHYKKLYISSEQRKLKGTGRLYDFVLEDLKVDPNHILHIGDNTVNDIDVPLKKGIAVYHVPKALDCFLRSEYMKGSKTCETMTKKLCGSFISYDKIEDSLGYRCMIAQCANKYFDNPYRHYLEGSILNGDSYFMGYYFVGMYLLGLNQWIENIVAQSDYDTIYFTSRDGWMPMKAYSMLRKIKPGLPKAEYFYTSRQAVLPAMIKDELDFYDLPIDLARYTPQKLYDLLAFCTERTEEEWKTACLKNEVQYEAFLENQGNMKRVTDIFLQGFYDRNKHQKCLEDIRIYYSKLNKKSIMFDLGYSGRIQDAISYLAGEGIDVMFVHSDAKKHDLLSRRSQFKIYSYYDFIPQMSDPLREYLLSAVAPSCIGYRREGDTCAMVFEKFNISKEEQEMAEQLQKGASDFVQDFYDNFGEVLEYIPYKSIEVSLPLEGFLRFSEEGDRSIFYLVNFGDKVYGGENSINLKEMIDLERAWLPNYLEI